jgi:hypothetical protein
MVGNKHRQTLSLSLLLTHSLHIIVGVGGVFAVRSTAGTHTIQITARTPTADLHTVRQPEEANQTDSITRRLFPLPVAKFQKSLF